jgi:hypothetical protein
VYVEEGVAGFTDAVGLDDGVPGFKDAVGLDDGVSGFKDAVGVESDFLRFKYITTVATAADVDLVLNFLVI